MPKSITATDLSVEVLGILVDDAGAVTALTATVNVDYDGARVREEFDLWAELTASQRTTFQAMYNKLTQRLQAAYLA